MNLLSESLSFDQAKVIVESANEGKDLYMKGICIQGGVRNANQRVYPVTKLAGLSPRSTSRLAMVIQY